MAPKSKPKSMLSSKGVFLKKRALAAAGSRFFIDVGSQLRPTGSPKSRFFLWKNKVFSKQRLSKITSISASILVPTCLHVGLQNGRFFEIIAFQEAFKISSFLGIDFGSIFASNMDPSWGPRRLKIQINGLLNISWRSPRTVLDTSLLLERVLDRLGLDSGGVRARVSEIFG